MQTLSAVWYIVLCRYETQMIKRARSFVMYFMSNILWVYECSINNEEKESYRCGGRTKKKEEKFEDAAKKKINEYGFLG